MIRWLLIAFIIYLIYRLMTGPGKKRRQNPTFTFRFGGFQDDENPDSKNKRGKTGKKTLDQIEDAEFEDITEDDIKEKKSNP